MRQRGQDRQVNMQTDALDAAHAQREHAPLVLQAPELALDRAALVVVPLEPARLARDQQMQARSLGPYRLRLALGRGAAPLGRAALDVGPGKGPLAVVAGWRLVLAGLDGGSPDQRDHGPD